MIEAKNTQRATVRLGYDGKVYKVFHGPDAQTRYANEVRVLRYLEFRECPFVPQVIEAHPERLELVTNNCGGRVEQISESKLKDLFAELEQYGVRHDDAYLRNVTYRESDGRFCLIDFEFATILDPSVSIDEDPNKGVDPKELLKVQLDWSGMTNVGRFRKNNEDAFLAAMLDRRGISYLGFAGSSSIDNREFIFAVSDGMGGQKSGEFASKIATQKITQRLPREFGMKVGSEQTYVAKVILELLESIHQDMLDLSKYDPNCIEMGATLTLVWFRNDRLYFGHIGDSRLYHLHADAGLQQLTEDHSHVGWLRRSGQINEREAREHPQRSALSQCLGSGHRYLRPQVGMVRYFPGDTFILLTDGVVEGIWDHAIEDLVRNPPSVMSSQTAAARLVLTAVKESGRDNATAVVIQTRA